MPFIDGYELIQYALDAETEDKIFMRWITGYQFQMNYDEFKKNLETNQEVYDSRTAEEILETVKDIIG